MTTKTLLSVADIAKLYQRTPGCVHVLAHRHKWRRIKHQGLVYYRHADVDKTLGA